MKPWHAMQSSLFPTPGEAILLGGQGRFEAEEMIRRHHYTHSIPSGKSHWVGFDEAIVVWSIPANNKLARSILGYDGKVWELSRLWAPDGHEPNLLTRAISHAVRWIEKLESPDALISYADPNAGHQGGVYRAASWIDAGASSENRSWEKDGKVVARRAFHSGHQFLRKADIEALGWKEVKRLGKRRFVKPLSRSARRAMKARNLTPLK